MYSAYSVSAILWMFCCCTNKLFTVYCSCAVWNVFLTSHTHTWSQGHNPQGQGQGLGLQGQGQGLDLRGQGQGQGLGLRGQGQGLGLQGQGQGQERCQGQCQYGSLFSQNFKTQTFIAGLVMTNFILIAGFSKLVMKLTVSFSQRTLKYFRVQWIFFK